MAYMTIEKLTNCFGVGYRVHDTITNGNMSYYGYSKREAEQKYRQDHNLKGVHFTRIYI